VSDEAITNRLPAWPDRSPVPAAMFNPALVATVIATAAHHHELTSGLAMQWTASFLVCPMVLHGPTRNALPPQGRSKLAKWVAEHETLMAGFAPRASRMVPSVLEGLRFGLREGAMATGPGGTLTADRAPSVNAKTPGDLAAIVRGSALLGRVFANTGDAGAIFLTLRVRP
jgi:hypothetical protein